MHNPESVQENDTHKILWDFEIQSDHLIRPIDINKEKLVDFAKPADDKVKIKEREKGCKHQDLHREQKKNETWRWWY